MANKEKKINISGGRYQYAIHAAAANGNIEMVRLLLDTGADLEATDPYGNTAIHWAAFREDLPLLSLFKNKLSLMKFEKGLRITLIVRLETRYLYDILALLVPETTIPQSALDSIRYLARSILSVDNLFTACILDSFNWEGKVTALLQKLGEVKITAPLFLSIDKLEKWSRDKNKIVSFLFEKGEFEVDEKLIAAICQFSISSQLISQMKAADIGIPPFTSKNIFSVLEHGSAESVAFFIQRTDDSLHSDAFLLAAVTNKYHGGEVMRLLLGWRPTYRIRDDIVMAAVQNYHEFSILLKTFIDRWDDLVFPVAALTVVVKRYDKDIVKLCYDRCKHPKITEDLLISTTWNTEKDRIIESLLECDLSLSVSQRVVEQVVSSCSQSVFKLLLDRCKWLIMTEDLLVNAANSQRDSAEILDLLMERDPTHAVSEPVMVAAVTNDSAVELIDIFLRRGKPLLLSEKVVEAAASNYRGGPEAFSLILRQNKDATISSSMIMTALQGRCGAAVISVLLRHDPLINMIEEALIAAATNRHDGSKIFALIQKNGNINKPNLPTKPTETEMEKCWLTFRKRLSSHRSRNVNTQITKKVIKAAAKNNDPVEVRTILALFEASGVLKEAYRKKYYSILEKKAELSKLVWETGANW